MLHGSDTKAKDILEYLKTLSPSGIELEFISLASFDFELDQDKKMLQDPNASIQ